jgi:hypothetical protein
VNQFRVRPRWRGLASHLRSCRRIVSCVPRCRCNHPGSDGNFACDDDGEASIHFGADSREGLVLGKRRCTPGARGGRKMDEDLGSPPGRSERRKERQGPPAAAATIKPPPPSRGVGTFPAAAAILLCALGTPLGSAAAAASRVAGRRPGLERHGQQVRLVAPAVVAFCEDRIHHRPAICLLSAALPLHHRRGKSSILLGPEHGSALRTRRLTVSLGTAATATALLYVSEHVREHDRGLWPPLRGCRQSATPGSALSRMSERL